MNDSYIRSFHKDCLSTVKYSKNIILLQKIWTAKVKLCDKGRFIIYGMGGAPHAKGGGEIFWTSRQGG